MIFGSVCSGIEAASVAWNPIGWETAFVAEIDKFPSAVLSHRFPEVPNLGDFTKIESPPRAIDVLVGGTPCQSFSVAGLRGGMADDRGNLALGFLRLAGRLRPRWLVWENVPGVLSSSAGRDFGSFLGGLAELGYGFAYRVLDAQYVRVDGFGRAVPQRRRRVFVVGNPGDWRRAAAVLFDRESLCWHSPPSRETGADVAGTLEARASTGGHDPGASGAASGHLIPVAYGGNSPGPIDVATACNAKGGTGRIDFESETFVVFPIQNATRSKSQNGLGIGSPGDPMFTLDNASQYAIAFQERGRKEGRTLNWQEDVSYALRAIDGGGCGDWFRVAYRWAVRRLTPRECERLQGFPDDWTLVPYRGKPAKDSPRYKAVGNSMAVPCMRWIGKRIQAVDDVMGEQP